MKEKFKEIIENDSKKAFVILTIVTVIIVSSVLAIYLIDYKKEENPPLSTTTRKATTNRQNLFKGYQSYIIDYEKEITYDLSKKHEFIYATNQDNTMIYTIKDNIELYYEIKLDSGDIIFTEQIYDKRLKAYKYTGNIYTYEANRSITEFIIASTCQKYAYAIVAIDDKGTIYKYETPESEYNISDIINDFKSINTISKAKRVGYYNLNNEPNVDCKGYTLIYEDIYNNIRTLENKNPLFFDSAFYRYLGSNFKDQYIYVFKDGKMKYDIGNNEYFINNGDHHIYYRGYFSEDNNLYENIYIFGVDGYLYMIENMSEESSQILNKVYDKRIKKVGTKVIKNENDFATDKLRLIIEFEDETFIEIEDIYNFELLS